MRIKGLKTKNLYFDFRHKDEGDTIKIHFHLKAKEEGKKCLGEKVGGLIVSKNSISDIHVGKRYLEYFDEVYNYEKQIRKRVKKYLEKSKQYKPDYSNIRGFKNYKSGNKPCQKLKKVYIEFLHPNGDDSIAFNFYIKKDEEFINIGFANVSPLGIKELHINQAYEIYFKNIYEKKENLIEYAKKCAIKNSKFLEDIKSDISGNSNSESISNTQQIQNEPSI